MTLDILAISPHPDDAELHCGGLLRKMADLGHSCGIIDLTAGEMGTRGTVQTRTQEASDASAILGIAERQNLNLPDAHLDQSQSHRHSIIQAIRTFRPQTVLIPTRNARHPDHRLTSILGQDASFLAGLEKIESGQSPHRPQQVIYYYTHYTYRQSSPSFIVDISDQYDRKIEAIQAYKTQFYNPDSTTPTTFISRPEFLEEIEVQNRYYGTLIGKKYGEPFIVREYLEMDDPVEYFGQRSER
ncbi:MAG: bacillithiol biosynthesis deacetylase BshB1 [Gemmatimonadota bacterium]|nr:bacillithiol biosynthesis deacetylase BshB1 [Gemmatimonadota bacterium]